jgi:hypothetical protein
VRRDKKVECHFIITRLAFTLAFSTYVCVLPCSFVSAWPSLCPLTSVNMEECVFNTESVLPETENSIGAGVTEVLLQSQCVTVSLGDCPEFFKVFPLVAVQNLSGTNLRQNVSKRSRELPSERRSCLFWRPANSDRCYVACRPCC